MQKLRKIAISVILLLILLLVYSIQGISIYAQENSNAPENSWVRKSAMPQGGAVFGAAAVDGEIYAFGGYTYNGTTYYTSEKYDPATDTWTTIAPMPNPTSDVAAVACQNKIYVIGGENQTTKGTLNRVYDPATDTWQTKAPIPIAIQDFTVDAADDKIYVIGGQLYNQPGTGSNPDSLSNATEVYNLILDSWASAAPIPISVGIVPASAGSKFYVIDSTLGLASTVVDGKIYVIGGDILPQGTGGSVGALDANRIYDPSTNKWSFGAPIPTAITDIVAEATTGLMAPEAIYVFGASSVNSTQVYVPKTNSWTTGAGVPGLPYYSAVVNVNDVLYVIGGEYSEFVGSGQEGGPATQIYNPPPPFSATNYQYTPFGYGTSSPIPVSSSSPTPSPTPSPSPPPSIIVPAILGAVVVVVAVAGLLVYFKKYKSTHN